MANMWLEEVPDQSLRSIYDRQGWEAVIGKHNYEVQEFREVDF